MNNDTKRNDDAIKNLEFNFHNADKVTKKVADFFGKEPNDKYLCELEAFPLSDEVLNGERQLEVTLSKEKGQ